MRKILFCLLIVNNSLFSQNTDPSNKWVRQLQRYTLSFGEIKNDTFIRNGKKEVVPYYYIIGSGVIFYINVRNKTLPVIVTAKHVLQDTKNKFRDSIRIRFSWHDDRSVYQYFGIPLSLKVPGTSTSAVFAYPDSSVDLACIALVPKEIGIRDTISTIPYSFFPNENQVFEGSEIYVLGYPGSVGKNYWTRALLRKGIIAWVDRAEVKNKFLVDCNVFPGNSGGPVFSKPDFTPAFTKAEYAERHKFIGIVIERKFNYNKVQSYRNGKLELLKDSEGFSVFSSESIGIAVVEPAINVMTLLKFYEIMLN